MTAKVTVKLSPSIALDFDGVIHQHVSPWTNAAEIHDPPVDGALQFIRNAIDAGWFVHVHTARANGVDVEIAIRQWFEKHGLEFWYIDRLKVSAVKPAAIVYIDDRGWRFEGKFPTLEEILTLKQWNKP